MTQFSDEQIARAARIARRFEIWMSGNVDVISVYNGSLGPINIEPGPGWATRLWEAMCELRPDNR